MSLNAMTKTDLKSSLDRLEARLTLKLGGILLAAIGLAAVAIVVLRSL